MVYIIDGNNLAGEIGLLDQDNFSEKLLKKLSGFTGSKKCDFYFVFDSAQAQGDKYWQAENVLVIRAPRDSYYKDADDKILEIVEEILGREEVTLVSSDRELKEKASKISREKKAEKKLKIENSSAFAFRVLGDRETNINEVDLSDQEVQDINKGLLEKFRRNKN